MPLEAKQIANFRLLYEITSKDPYDSCAEDISNCSSAQIVPVIINIAEEIKEKQQDNTEDSFINKIIIEMKKIDKLHDIAKGLTFSALTIISDIIAHFPLGIKNHLDQLLESAKKAVINPEHVKLWREAACWLEGLHRCCNKSYKEQGYVTTYSIDWAMGLSQSEMMGYLHNMAKAIMEKITPKPVYEANNSMLLFKVEQQTLPKPESLKDEMEPPKFQ